MPLETQIVPIPLGQGVDTKTDPKQLAIGKMSVLTNARFTVAKEINKRPGHAALSQSILGGTTIASGVSLASYKNELTCQDGQDLYSYSSSTGNWVTKGLSAGATINGSLSTTSIYKTTTQQTVADSVINGNLQCFVWYDTLGPGPLYSIIDTTTGQTLVTNGLNAANKIKVLAIGSYFIIITGDGSLGQLKYWPIATAFPLASPSATSIAADLSTAHDIWDACVINSKVYLAYNNTSAKVTVFSLTSGLVLSSAFDIGSEHANFGIGIFGDASFNVWVVYQVQAGNLKAAVANAALGALVLGITTLDNTAPTLTHITGVVSGTTAMIFYDRPGTVLLNSYINSVALTLAGAVGSPNSFFNSCTLRSKCFFHNARWYMWVYYASNSTLQDTYFLIDNVGRTIGKLSYGVASDGTLTSTSPILPEINLVSSGVYQAALLIKDNLTSVDGNVFTLTGVQSAQFTFSSSAPSKFTLGENLHFTGSQLNMYDGRTIVEHGFHLYPDTSATAPVIATAGALGPGVSTTAVNQWQYKALYEWEDNQGQLHRSAPSSAITVKMNGGSTLYLTGTFTNATSQITAISSTAGIKEGMRLTGFGTGMNVVNGIVNTVTSATVLQVSIAFTGSTGTFSFVVTPGPVLVFPASCATTYNSSIVTTASTTGLLVGQTISELSVGTHFPVGAYIVSIVAGVSFTVSVPALKTDATVTTFYTQDVQKVTVAIPYLHQSSKINISMILYRTLVNQSVFFRVNSPLVPTYNSFGSGEATIADAVSDNALQGNEQLYTTGGEIENIAAPACYASTTYKSRAILLTNENKNSFWYSKQVIPGQPVEFSDFFVQNIDSKGGDLGAASPMDDKLLLFKAKNNVFYMVGTGPGPSGSNNDFSEPVLISSDVGCNNQSSVVEFPLGVLFQASNGRGIYIVSRSLEVAYIGADVEAYNAQTITSALRIPNSTTIQFMLNSGTALIYDWFYNQWNVDALPAAAVDATIFSGQHAYIESTGLVEQEVPGLYTDNAAFIPLAPTTGWLNFASIQGFQRVKELLIVGNYYGPHSLIVSISYDFSSVVGQTVTIPVLSDPGVYQFRVFLNQQKCESIKISITDSQGSNFNQGYSLSALTLQVGVKRGLDKLTAAQSYG